MMIAADVDTFGIPQWCAAMLGLGIWCVFTADAHLRHHELGESLYSVNKSHACVA